MKKLYIVLIVLMAFTATTAMGQCIEASGNGVYTRAQFPRDSLNISLEFDATPTPDPFSADTTVSNILIHTSYKGFAWNTFDSNQVFIRFYRDTTSTLWTNTNKDHVLEGWFAAGPNYKCDSLFTYTYNTYYNVTYHVRLAINIRGGKYAMYATAPGGTEQFIGNYPFRSFLRFASKYSDTLSTAKSTDPDAVGYVNICNIQTHPYIHTMGGPTGTWVYNRIQQQSGTFQAAFDVMLYDTNTTTSASAPKNQLIGLWDSTVQYRNAPPAYTALDSIPILIRFDSTKIQVWDSSSGFTSDNVVNYIGWKNYHFRLLVNTPAKTYTVYVTPAGGSEILLANNYPFRATSATRIHGIGCYGARFLTYANAGADSSKGNIDISNFITNPTGVEQTKENVPTDYVLNQNYPNPFNPSTIISYQLPATSNVKLVVFDMLGREVATLVNGVQTAGTQKVEFKAQGFASGMYFYKLTAGNFSQIKKMVLMK